MADAAQLGGEFVGGANDGLEEAFRDLQQVSLVLLQVLFRFQPADTPAAQPIGAEVTAQPGGDRSTPPP